ADAQPTGLVPRADAARTPPFERGRATHRRVAPSGTVVAGHSLATRRDGTSAPRAARSRRRTRAATSGPEESRLMTESSTERPSPADVVQREGLFLFSRLDSHRYICSRLFGGCAQSSTATHDRAASSLFIPQG